MQSPKSVLDLFKAYTPVVDAEIDAFLTKDRSGDMYRMMRYFMGYIDEQFNPVTSYGGKRFRAGLCLLLADAYGKKDEALKMAAAIELFHNFSLIHDDIEDRDELRRGRPTVWKLWGINHGINTGDAQLILTQGLLFMNDKLSPEKIVETSAYLNEKSLKVVEGQYLDFVFSERDIDDVRTTEEAYFDMISKKSAELIGAAAEVAGIIRGVEDAERRALWEYGFNLGIAYQLVDDHASIWGLVDTTGKAVHKDIVERKKTLPIMRTLQQLKPNDQETFAAIYNKTGELTEEEVQRIIELVDSTDARDYVGKSIRSYDERSRKAIESLSISQDTKDLLVQLNTVLLV